MPIGTARTKSQHQGDNFVSTEKGIPFSRDPRDAWSIFDDDVAFPTVVLLDSALEHNGRAMKDYCASSDVSIAPHGKTTMTPYIFSRQLDDGAWAITAASVWQAMRMREAGVNRVLIANQVVMPGELAWLAQAIDAGFEVYCYVDSIEGVEIMTEAMQEANVSRPLPVLLEVGIEGGRTGTRTVEGALAVAKAAAASPWLALTGTAGFEGIITATETATVGDLVDAFLDKIVEVTHAVASNGWFEPTPEVIVTAGGSAYFDHVVDRFSHVDIAEPTRVVIRSGCYITHDDGGYDRSSPLGSAQRVQGERFVPAIEVWGPVLSRPEPGRVIVGVGKRDVTHDGLLPLAKKVRRSDGGGVVPIDPIRVTVLNDQHIYLDVDPAFELSVGDLVGFGISHPCLTFDKWRSIPVVDDDYNVIEVAGTTF
jgi:D-serine dehydratase